MRSSWRLDSVTGPESTRDALNQFVRITTDVGQTVTPSSAMSKLRLKISMSLDGFVAGPNQSVENPLGIGGDAAARVGRSARRPGGRRMASRAARSTRARAWSRSRSRTSAPRSWGATCSAAIPGPWDAEQALERLVGRQSAVPSSGVRAHASRARAARAWKAERRSRSSPTASKSALEQARRAARRQGCVARRRRRAPRGSILLAGLVDEMEINLVPDAARQRRAAVRRRRRRSARARARANGRGAEGDAPQVLARR